MKIIAHRGSAKLAPENSLKALELSKKLGVSAVEFDIRLTKDKKLVVFHDKTLQRLGNSKQKIANLTLSEVLSIKLKNGQNIPSLERYLEAAGSMPLFIEGKGSGWAEELTRELKNYPHKDSVEVISFNETELKKFADLNQNISVSVNRVFSGRKAITIAMQNGFSGINLFVFGFNPLVYYLARKNNLTITVYTLNNRVDTWIMRLLYSDVGIITDNPPKIKSVIKD